MTLTITQEGGLGVTEIATLLAAIGALVAAGAAWRQVKWARKAVEAALTYHAPWRVERVGTSYVVLRNEGPETIEKVRIQIDEWSDEEVESFDAYSNRFISYGGSVVFHPDGTEMVVTWKRPSETSDRTWRTQLLAKPDGG